MQKDVSKTKRQQELVDKLQVMQEKNLKMKVVKILFHQKLLAGKESCQNKRKEKNIRLRMNILENNKY